MLVGRSGGDSGSRWISESLGDGELAVQNADPPFDLGF